MLVTVRRGKTNQEGETKKGGVARAFWILRAVAYRSPPKMVGLRFSAAAHAAADKVPMSSS